MKNLLRLIFICFLSNLTFAQINYYVDNSLGNDIPGNGGSPGTSAWKTIEYAVINVSNPSVDEIIINISNDVYDLSNNQIDINRGFINLTVLGQSTANTIVQSASDTSYINQRVFKIYAGNTVTLRQLSVRNGGANADLSGDGYNHGGGIFNLFGNLTVENCKVTENVSGLTGTGYGAGICNVRGTLIVSNSTISNNTGPFSTTLPFYGGGIASIDGSATIINSTISYNTAPGGGGIAIISGEGNTDNSNFEITNSTISENRGYNSYGGIRISRFGATNSKTIISSFSSCTIFQNYAGIDVQNTGSYGGFTVNSELVTTGIQTNIRNSIFAGNKSASNIDLSFQSGIGIINSDDYNIIQNYNGQAITGQTTNNVYGQTPNLQPLNVNSTANGTYTCATLTGSIAIDKIPGPGFNGALPQDQRGAERNGNADIGAYEWWSDDGALPVELTSFTAQIENNKVVLNWSTATETNNYGFEVERALSSTTPLRVWEKIGFINGNGTSNSPKSYSFIDENVSAGIYSYRLKQIDNDGQFEYSEIISIDLGSPDKFELSQNYPNPFNPSTKISWQSPVDSWQTLIVYDVLGNEVTTLINEYKPAGKYEVEFNVAQESLPAITSGVYFYRLQVGSFVQTRKMILMK